MRAALLFILLLSALPALGLEPYLVKDVNPVPEPADSSPDYFVNLGSVALFGADDGITGRELWRSDGTAAGTWQVADLCRPDCSGKPTGFALTDHLYFFFATDENYFRNLWATDGTPAGTFQLTDTSIHVETRTWIGDVLYFIARDAAHGRELWRSDGTPAGTHIVTDLRPGPEGSDPRSPVPFKGSLYFAADDGRVGGALWKTDGTAAGTVLVKDPVPSSPTNFRPAMLRAVGSRLLFVAPTPSRGQELWSSDGTVKGTQVISDIVPGPGSPVFLDSSVQGGRLYFVADDGRKGQELWVSDGTAKGTRGLTNLARKEAFFSSADGDLLYLPLAAAGNRFVFGADDGPHGAEPWVTDGTVKGTRLLKDLCPGSCGGVSYIVDSPPLAGRRFLVGTNGTRGQELWVTDGTEAGTRLVRDICRGSCDAWPGAPFIVKDLLIFAADDGVHGDEVWSTDGTAAGTVRISDFAPETPWDGFEGWVAGDQLLFGAPGPEGRELWRTDGTAAGTRLVRDINDADVGGSFPNALMALDDEAFFFAYDGGDPAPTLWKSDGTEAGTLKVKVFSPEEAESSPTSLLSEDAGGLLFFRARQNVLWRTDGTEGGTYPLGVRVCCNVPAIRAVGSTVFFPSREEDHPVGLWASDGTVAGTRQVVPGDSGPFEPRELTAFQGKLYFSADSPDDRGELWRSDGTEAGTVLVKDINPFSDSEPRLLTVHAGRLWFFADDGVHGRELWSSDGTGAGTALAVNLEPGASSFEPTLLVSLGDRLLVFGFSQSQGEGLWVTDGTPAGTRKISGQGVGHSFDSPPGIVFRGRFYYRSGLLFVTDGTEAGTGPFLDRDGMEISDTNRFAVLDDHLLFSGVALWESDGTPAGTFRLVPEIIPWGNSPSELLRAGSRVFFPGYSREDGLELWAVEESHP